MFVLATIPSQFSSVNLLFIGWQSIANPCRLLRAVKQISERSFVHQEGLPKLPVPPLKQTCERYLAALEPILQRHKVLVFNKTWISAASIFKEKVSLVIF
uniref:Choline/carnitine acyltransferase domain-containing protein n=1 Tax=Poecilia mexicana TaxID=48701 RepID=A0A3B3YHZ8_9TELE